MGERLEAITGHVDQRLDEGFRKTNETFTSVMARLATIDGPRRRSAISPPTWSACRSCSATSAPAAPSARCSWRPWCVNALPPEAFDFQYTLPNGTRADCVLRLPEPTGMVIVDSKFPSRTTTACAPHTGELERRAAQGAFRGDVKKHVDAIAGKYILPDVTSDGAVMFIPAEAVFAEIHAYHPGGGGLRHDRRVWIVSPTTLMACSTPPAVLERGDAQADPRDQDALGKLAKDFNRRRAHAEARHPHPPGRRGCGRGADLIAQRSARTFRRSGGAAG